MSLNLPVYPIIVRNAVLMVTMSLAVPSASWAGFQWVPPQQSPPAVETFPSAQQHLATIPSPVVISPEPIILSAPPKNKDMANAFPQLTVIEGQTDTKPLDTWQASTTPTPPIVKSPLVENKTKGNVDESLVQGFADNIPLAVAVRQLVPADRGFAVAPDVDSGALVSWQGGKPWRTALDEMLAPSGLRSEERDGVVTVVRAKNDVAAATHPPISLLSTSPANPPNQPQQLVAQPVEAVAAVNILPSPPTVNIVEPMIMETAPNAHPQSLPPANLETWTANRGDMLHKILKDWARRSNIEISWLAEYDYPLQASLTITGTFEEAVRQLLSGFHEAKPQPIAQLHMDNKAEHAVLVVDVRGNNYGN